jgi:hypothetical protein
MQAVWAVEYERRQVGRPEGISAREAAGHDRPAVRADRHISIFVDEPPYFVELSGLSRRDVRRAARYDNLVRQMAEGRVSAATFRRRVGRWRPIDGRRFLSDPDAVLAVLEDRRALDLEIFVYTSGRS